MHLLFVFIDGLGLGQMNSFNPFYTTETKNITRLLDGKGLTASNKGYSGAYATLLGLDATLCMPGTPQSATGQASLFTGLNAAAYLGRHVSGFPGPKLRHFLARNGMFKRLQEKGFKPCFANAYSPPFFHKLAQGLPGHKYSCTTLITYYSGLPFLNFVDLKKGKAIYMDITNSTLSDLGWGIQQINTEVAAKNLINKSKHFDLTLFEYFLSDIVGHSRDKVSAEREVIKLDSFIGSLAEQIDYDTMFMLITSDHGNIEDLSLKGHTTNEVPLLLMGKRELREQCNEVEPILTAVVPLIERLLGV